MNIPKQNIENAISGGVGYLYEHQFPNGEFCCYIGHEDNMKDCIPHSNVFPTSLISYSLLSLAEMPKVKEILDLSCAFLQFQSMRGGVWNNFTVWHPYFRICPADVDNTACASKVLQARHKEYPKNEQILLVNRNKAGLFYTWYTLRPHMVWDKNYWLLSLREFKQPIISTLFWIKNECTRYDIDGAVNANVLFYLGLRPETEAVVSYLLEVIAQEKEGDCDLWYRNPFTIYYFISRNYRAGIAQLAPAGAPVIERILSTAGKGGSFGESILDTALGIISLINWGFQSEVLDQAVLYLLDQQKKAGNWARWAVYYGGPKKLQCYGSEEMTTGFCLEALALYRDTNGGRNEGI